jgi:RNA polymerase sigma-70 factor (ECF subfamily)
MPFWRSARWSTTPDRAGADVAVDRVFRAERAKLVASLVRLLDDWDLAEEVVQDAVVAALEHWPRDGIPDKPAAWLLTTARRRALDRIRRDATFRSKAADIVRYLDDQDPDAVGGVDDRLRLIFTCCHPALAKEAQIALTLKTVAGLSTAEVARAFLVPETTIAQRVVRAKQKIRRARIPYRIPDDDELPSRVDEVLAVLYLVFNEGYLATSQATRLDLAAEAEWLTSVLVELMPDEPEPIGLLALMRLHLARSASRFTQDGSLVLLADQDRSLWNHGAIAAAASLLSRASALGRPGPYQEQAAIALCHARAPSFSETDWWSIVVGYDRLLEMTPSPVVALNRAIALAHAAGANAGLDALDPLAEQLDRYQPFHAARSELLRRAGRRHEALDAARRALDLATNPAERRLLESRIDELE